MPYSGILSPSIFIKKGRKPGGRPDLIKDAVFDPLWSAMERSWELDPTSRPALTIYETLLD
jgi:hypothetical protein